MDAKQPATCALVQTSTSPPATLTLPLPSIVTPLKNDQITVQGKLVSVTPAIAYASSPPLFVATLRCHKETIRLLFGHQHDEQHRSFLLQHLGRNITIAPVKAKAMAIDDQQQPSLRMLCAEDSACISMDGDGDGDGKADCEEGGRVLSYTGVVTGVEHAGAALVLDNGRMHVLMAHYPADDIPDLLIGSEVCLWHVHAVRKGAGDDGEVVWVAACASSSVFVTRCAALPDTTQRMIELLPADCELRHYALGLTFRATLWLLEAMRSMPKMKLVRCDTPQEEGEFCRRLLQLCLKQYGLASATRRDGYANILLHDCDVHLHSPSNDNSIPKLQTLSALLDSARQHHSAHMGEGATRAGERVTTAMAAKAEQPLIARLEGDESAGRLFLSDGLGTRMDAALQEESLPSSSSSSSSSLSQFNELVGSTFLVKDYTILVHRFGDASASASASVSASLPHCCVWMRAVDMFVITSGKRTDVDEDYNHCADDANGNDDGCVMVHVVHKYRQLQAATGRCKLLVEAVAIDRLNPATQRSVQLSLHGAAAASFELVTIGGVFSMQVNGGIVNSTSSIGVHSPLKRLTHANIASLTQGMQQQQQRQVLSVRNALVVNRNGYGAFPDDCVSVEGMVDAVRDAGEGKWAVKIADKNSARDMMDVYFSLNEHALPLAVCPGALVRLLRIQRRVAKSLSIYATFGSTTHVEVLRVDATWTRAQAGGVALKEGECDRFLAELDPCASATIDARGFHIRGRVVEVQRLTLRWRCPACGIHLPHGVRLREGEQQVAGSVCEGCVRGEQERYVFDVEGCVLMEDGTDQAECWADGDCAMAMLGLKSASSAPYPFQQQQEEQQRELSHQALRAIARRYGCVQLQTGGGWHAGARGWVSHDDAQELEDCVSRACSRGPMVLEVQQYFRVAKRAGQADGGAWEERPLVESGALRLRARAVLRSAVDCTRIARLMLRQLLGGAARNDTD